MKLNKRNILIGVGIYFIIGIVIATSSLYILISSLNLWAFLEMMWQPLLEMWIYLVTMWPLYAIDYVFAMGNSIGLPFPI